jgi:hypothetical protein
MKKTFLLILLLFSFLFTNAQKEYQRPNIGFGSGLNYGGFGINIGGSPVDYLSLSIFGGYNLVKLNAGAGASIFFRPYEKMFRPSIKLIYGANAAIKGESIDYYYFHINRYGTCYYGTSAGLGFAWRFIKDGLCGLDFDIFYPFISEEFYKDYDKEKRIHPINLSVSIHFWNIKKSN